MHSLKTKLDPWSVRLLAIVATAPLLHCGGRSEHDSDGMNGATGGTRNGSSGSGSGSGGTVSAGAGGIVSAGAGGTAGSVASGGAGAVAGAAGRFPCVNPTPLDPTRYTGFEQCEGFKHRPESVACQSLLPRPTDWTPTASDLCKADTDCTDRPNGYCTPDYGGTRVCSYGCTTDAECGSNSVCMCGSIIGSCLIASCKSDAECGDGLLCASYPNEFCGDGGFACQDPNDECASQAQCGPRRCDIEPDGVRRCSEGGCAIIGRPFLVGDSLRVAPSATRTDWTSSEVERELRAVAAKEREALGAAWLRNALMEHASIAAFARFTLELLAVGAPADLIRDSNAAASDETRHAELCFALASEYLGEPVGPGALKIDGALDGISLEKLVVTAIAEGCIGETVAAVEAAEQLAHASDPRVRAVLGRISEDETRHAELAWRFVAWALEREPSLHGVVEREFARQLSAPASFSKESEPDLSRHGILPELTRAALRSAVLAGVIRQCAGALLEREISVPSTVVRKAGGFECMR